MAGACCCKKSWCHAAAAFAAWGLWCWNACGGGLLTFRRWKSAAQSGAWGACANCRGGCAKRGAKCWKSCGGGPSRPAWKASNSESKAPAFAPGDDLKPCTVVNHRLPNLTRDYLHAPVNVCRPVGPAAVSGRRCCVSGSSGGHSKARKVRRPCLIKKQRGYQRVLKQNVRGKLRVGLRPCIMFR